MSNSGLSKDPTKSSSQKIELDFQSGANLNRISLSPDEISHIEGTNYSPEMPAVRQGTANEVDEQSVSTFTEDLSQLSLGAAVEEEPKIDMSKYQNTPNDSNDPSYSKLKLPYSVVCRQRYIDAGKKMRAQFIKEIQAHELLRGRALDGVRIHREFCNPIVKKIDKKEIITLTPKQKERVEYILRSPHF